MEFFASHDQFVADLPSDDQQNHFGILPVDFIQHAKILNTEFKLCQRIRPKAADRLRGPGRLVTQSSLHCRLNDALFANWQGSQLPVRFVRNRNVKRHPRGPAARGTTVSKYDRPDYSLAAKSASGHARPSKDAETPANEPAT
jgi:hypothetical protein